MSDAQNTYETFKQQWEALQAVKRREPSAHPASDRARLSSHAVSYKDLVRELSYLRKITKDPRFFDAIDAVLDHGLVEDEKWRRKFKPKAPENYSETYIEWIGRRMARGDSLRVACAWLVYDFDIESVSFSAAVEKLKRLWRNAELNGSVPPRNS